MSIVGLQRVTYGVADLADAARFWTDFGLKSIPSADDERVFATQEGAEVVLRPLDHAGLPPAPGAGPTAREITWAEADDAAPQAIAARLPASCRRDGAPGCVAATDPAGHAMAFE